MKLSEKTSSASTWNPFSAEQWIAWLGATAIAAISMTVFFFSTFESKDSFTEFKLNEIKDVQELTKRLERIEDKLDRLIEKK